MLHIIIEFHKYANNLINSGKTIQDVMDMDMVTEISRMKYMEDKDFNAMYNKSIERMNGG